MICESAIMIALATILSLLKVVDLPYGGSITLASMLPIVIIAYRHGTLWGLLTGLVHGVLQLLLGTSTLSYVTGAASVIAVIVLDYIFAFALIGIAGAFRRIKDQKSGLLIAAISAGVLRYICHVIAGATVWAGLSIPTASALTYSIIYNATYMLPETLVLAACAFYLGSCIDFRKDRLAPVAREAQAKISRPFVLSAGIVALGTLIFDIASVFSKLQNADSGEFDLAGGITEVNWTAVVAVTAAGAVLCAILLIIGRKTKKS